LIEERMSSIDGSALMSPMLIPRTMSAPTGSLN
jgi:hypothetical protein